SRRTTRRGRCSPSQRSLGRRCLPFVRRISTFLPAGSALSSRARPRTVMLSDFLTEHREVLLVRARDKVLRRRVPLPTDYELKHGVPIFLDQLAETLRLEAEGDGRPIPEMRPDAVHPASDLFKQGITIGQAVHDYGDI